MYGLSAWIVDDIISGARVNGRSVQIITNLVTLLEGDIKEVTDSSVHIKAVFKPSATRDFNDLLDTSICGAPPTAIGAIVTLKKYDFVIERNTQTNAREVHMTIESLSNVALLPGLVLQSSPMEYCADKRVKEFLRTYESNPSSAAASQLTNDSLSLSQLLKEIGDQSMSLPSSASDSIAHKNIGTNLRRIPKLTAANFAIADFVISQNDWDQLAQDGSMGDSVQSTHPSNSLSSSHNIHPDRPTLAENANRNRPNTRSKRSREICSVEVQVGDSLLCAQSQPVPIEQSSQRINTSIIESQGFNTDNISGLQAPIEESSFRTTQPSRDTPIRQSTQANSQQSKNPPDLILSPITANAVKDVSRKKPREKSDSPEKITDTDSQTSLEKSLHIVVDKQQVDVYLSQHCNDNENEVIEISSNENDDHGLPESDVPNVVSTQAINTRKNFSPISAARQKLGVITEILPKHTRSQRDMTNKTKLVEVSGSTSKSKTQNENTKSHITKSLTPIEIARKKKQMSTINSTSGNKTSPSKAIKDISSKESLSIGSLHKDTAENTASQIGTNEILPSNKKAKKLGTPTVGDNNSTKTTTTSSSTSNKKQDKQNQDTPKTSSLSNKKQRNSDARIKGQDRDSFNTWLEKRKKTSEHFHQKALSIMQSDDSDKFTSDEDFEDGRKTSDGGEKSAQIGEIENEVFVVSEVVPNNADNIEKDSAENDNRDNAENFVRTATVDKPIKKKMFNFVTADGGNTDNNHSDNFRKNKVDDSTSLSNIGAGSFYSARDAQKSVNTPGDTQNKIVQNNQKLGNTKSVVGDGNIKNSDASKKSNDNVGKTKQSIVEENKKVSSTENVAPVVKNITSNNKKITTSIAGKKRKRVLGNTADVFFDVEPDQLRKGKSIVEIHEEPKIKSRKPSEKAGSKTILTSNLPQNLNVDNTDIYRNILTPGKGIVVKTADVVLSEIAENPTAYRKSGRKKQLQDYEMSDDDDVGDDRTNENIRTKSRSRTKRRFNFVSKSATNTQTSSPENINTRNQEKKTDNTKTVSSKETEYENEKKSQGKLKLKLRKIEDDLVEDFELDDDIYLSPRMTRSIRNVTGVALLGGSDKMTQNSESIEISSDPDSEDDCYMPPQKVTDKTRKTTNSQIHDQNSQSNVKTRGRGKRVNARKGTKSSTDSDGSDGSKHGKKTVKLATLEKEVCCKKILVKLSRCDDQLVASDRNRAILVEDFSDIEAANKHDIEPANKHDIEPPSKDTATNSSSDSGENNSDENNRPENRQSDTENKMEKSLSSNSIKTTQKSNNRGKNQEKFGTSNRAESAHMSDRNEKQKSDYLMKICMKNYKSPENKNRDRKTQNAKSQPNTARDRTNETDLDLYKPESTIQSAHMKSFTQPDRSNKLCRASEKSRKEGNTNSSKENQKSSSEYKTTKLGKGNTTHSLENQPPISDTSPDKHTSGIRTDDNHVSCKTKNVTETESYAIMVNGERRPLVDYSMSEQSQIELSSQRSVMEVSSSRNASYARRSSTSLDNSSLLAKDSSAEVTSSGELSRQIKTPINSLPSHQPPRPTQPISKPKKSLASIMADERLSEAGKQLLSIRFPQVILDKIDAYSRPSGD